MPGWRTAPSSTASRRSCGPRASTGSGSPPTASRRPRTRSRPSPTPSSSSSDRAASTRASCRACSSRPSATPSLHASAPRIFVCNVATQEGETTGYDLAAHVDALVAHTGPDLVDVVLANNHFVPATSLGLAAIVDGTPPKAVRLRWPPAAQPAPRLILDDVVDPTNPHHHDPVRLAAAVIRALEGEVGLRRRTTGADDGADRLT